MTRTMLTMPRLGETMERGRLVAWLKAPGETFVRAEPLAEIETDKTVVELPALCDGRIISHLAEPHEDVAVGAPLAEIEVAQDAAGEPAAAPVAADPADAPAAAEPSAAPVAADPADAPAAAAPAAVSTQGGERASPAARWLARREGVDLAALTGTGRRGRIDVADVEAATPRGAGPVALPQGEPHVLEVAGGRIAYDRFGSPHTGRSIVLIHGYAGDRTSFAGFAPLLSRRAQVIVPDLPGHGLTSLDASSAEEMHGAVDDLAQHLELDPAATDLVGLSMGGIVAAHLAAAWLGRGTPPRRLVLVSPAGLGSGVDHAFVAALAAGPTAGALRHLLRRVASRANEPSPELLEAIAGRLAQRRLDEIAANLCDAHGQRHDITGHLAALVRHLDVAIAVGTQDRILPWQDVVNAPALASVHIFSGAGHMIHWDEPDALAELINRD